VTQSHSIFNSNKQYIYYSNTVVCRQLAMNMEEADALAALHEELRGAVLSRFGNSGQCSAPPSQAHIEALIEERRYGVGRRRLGG